MDLVEVHNILSRYLIEGEIVSIAKFGNGHINDTFRIETADSKTPDYLLQRVNKHVFRDMEALESNMGILDRHFHHGPGNEWGIDIPTALISKEGNYLVSVSRNTWRLYIFCKDTFSYDEVTDNVLLTDAGRAFGSFIRTINSSELGLASTIPKFNNLKFRFDQLQQAKKAKRAPARLEESKKLLEMAESHYVSLTPFLSTLEKLPQRAVHNDTKINNLLFGPEGKASHVVDLDTVMPGKIHYDFGDTLRTTATNKLEDAEDFTEMRLDEIKIESFSKGFIPQVKAILTDNEISTLQHAPNYMAFIMGIRFLADYLNGDIYYKTSYQKQNFNRASNQLTLASLFSKSSETIRDLIYSCIS